MPKVSVVIPVYGVEKYIERCARSLFEQTLDDIEYIFVNDCTKDRSIDILNAVINDYPARKDQVRIIYHEKNKGLPFARQSGWQVATGEYIANCDSDDWVDLNLYEMMYNVAIEKNADIVVSDFISVRQDGTERICGLRNVNASKEDVIKDIMYMRTLWCIWNKLFRHDLLLQLEEPPQKYMAEDMSVTLPLYHKSDVIAYCQTACYFYNVRIDTASHQTSLEGVVKNYKEITENFAIVQRFYSKEDKKGTYKRALNNVHFFHIMSLLPYIKEKEVRQLLRECPLSVFYYMITDRKAKTTRRKKAFKLLMKRLLGLI